VEAALSALAATGPMAVVLGSAVLTLWRKLAAIQIYYQGDPDDKDKPGLIARHAASAQAREDGLREQYEDREAKLRSDLKAVYKELNDTLRGEFIDDV